MAAEIKYETTDPAKNAMDYAEHEKTYQLFLGMTKWLTIIVAAVLTLMAIFLTGH